MPKTKENAKVLRGSEILGIYGQNGSGKQQLSMHYIFATNYGWQ